MTEDELFAPADSDATDDLASLLPEETRDTQRTEASGGASGGDSLSDAEGRASYDGQADWGTEAPANPLADALEDELLQNP